MEWDYQSRHVVSGTVKWFDTTRGFGFICPDDGGEDILLHANVLYNSGRSSVVKDARAEVEVESSQRGLQAVAVRSITPPDATDPDGFDDLRNISHEELQALPREPARVKWFDQVKGFGFANVFERSGDVFVHIEVLRRCGMSDLRTGEAVILRVIDSARGRVAVEVAPWEGAGSREVDRE